MRRTGALRVECPSGRRYQLNRCYHSVVLKVGMVGDSQIGKTSLM